MHSHADVYVHIHALSWVCVLKNTRFLKADVKKARYVIALPSASYFLRISLPSFEETVMKQQLISCRPSNCSA